MKKPPVYIFGWPSHVGGADTKVAHLLMLLHEDFSITMVPNRREQLLQLSWRKFLKRLGVAAKLWEDLPKRLEGVGMAFCNAAFFTDGIALRARQRGLRILWSNEMMWHAPGELAAVAFGVVDKILYASEVQRAVLEAGYGAAPGVVTGNYIDARLFPFAERRRAAGAPLVIGRLSRADPAKFPADFPAFYESLEEGWPRAGGSSGTRFRVMAWSAQLRALFSRHRFDARWELLEAGEEPAAAFLHSVDLFVYSLGAEVRESWGRSTVEAMLTGAVPLVPADARHHLRELVPDGECGCLCATPEEFREGVARLRKDLALRRRLSRAARSHAEHVLCRRAEHLGIWRRALME